MDIRKSKEVGKPVMNEKLTLLEESPPPSSKKTFGSTINVFLIILVTCIVVAFAVIFLISLALILIFVPSIPTDPLERAKYLASHTPLIDGHNDYPEKVIGILQSGWPKKFNFMKELSPQESTLLRKHGEVIQSDGVKFGKGKLGGQFWSVYEDCHIMGQEAIERALNCFEVVHEMMDFYSDYFHRIRHSSEIMSAFHAGKFISLIGVEGGQMINSNLQVLKEFYELGSRYMTLTHNCNTEWADACCDPVGPVHNGLTPFGKDVIRFMNKIGMIVDISHVSHKTMLDTLEVTKAPVMFSHSNAYTLCNHERNVRDDVLSLVKQNNGIVMVVFYNPFVSEFERQANANFSIEYPNNVTQKLLEWEKNNPTKMASVEMVVDHIDYIRNLIGVEHIGIGSDFDGVGLIHARGLEDTSKFMNLFEVLIKRGYTDHEISLILGKNIIRVLSEVELVSQSLQNNSTFFCNN